MNTKRHIKAFYPNFFSDRLIAYVCLSIIRNFNTNTSVADAMGLSSDTSMRPYKKSAVRHGNHQTGVIATPRIYYDAIPPTVCWPAISRILDNQKIQGIAESRYLRRLRREDVAYLWPGASVRLYEKARSKGCVVVAERINTLRSNSMRILDGEFASLGIPATHGITPDTVRNETMCMELADYVFSPSPAVATSLEEAGIPREKILSTSYGLRKEDILDVSRDNDGDKPVTAIFVGRICVRKGIHLLLRAWVKANVNGRLRIVGRVSPEIQDMFLDHLRRYPTIEHVDYVEDLRPIYRGADLFILPSIEEGSPLVTYLALGASLPVIVSPMGSGGVIVDNQEGLVVDPHDETVFAEAIRKLSSDPLLRNQMAAASGRKAPKYTWDQVAAQRIRQLLARLGS